MFLPRLEQNFLTVLYSLTTFVSISGNILSIIVFAKGKKCKTDIKPYLLNLAVADLIMGIFWYPFIFILIFKNELASHPVFCTLVSYLQSFSVNMSSFMNVAIGVDRLIAVLFPLKYRITTSRSRPTIALIWLLSAATSSVPLFFIRIEKVNQGGKNHVICISDWENSSHYFIYVWVMSICTSFLPFTMLTVTYAILANFLWKRITPGNENQIRDQLATRAKIKVVKMLFVIVVLFGLCWMPITIAQLILIHKG
ncbi:tachykinin-like peptides receptor 86C isoform X2 [Octopus sinensis]|uniref:Tachykinin-like peptides receptor 86C isoform X2 n=1 Tax=Octopus sinensis TaxID=2607531 RepID=A0A7E6FJH8_9MOLL|nr:tachykinin-like peptides receptor 86C isoform X2 [Octopus sinensis]